MPGNKFIEKGQVKKPGANDDEEIIKNTDAPHHGEDSESEDNQKKTKPGDDGASKTKGRPGNL